MSTPTIQHSLQDRFGQLREQWKAQSRLLSNTAQMSMLWPYQQIIGMGPSALPLILRELKREPDLRFWALEAITGENPVPAEAAGKVDEMSRAWIEWGRSAGLLSHDA